MARWRLTAVATAALAAAMAAGAAPVDEGCAVKWWPQQRQSSCANGSAVDAQAPRPENVAQLELAWTFRPDGDAGRPIVHAGPVMRAPYVYLPTSGERNRLYALELATGKVRWASKRAGAGIALADRDVLLVWGDQAPAARFVPRSGHLVWVRKGLWGTWLDQPLLAGGAVYAAKDVVIAWDARTARPLWQSDVQCEDCGIAASGGRVYVASADEPYPLAATRVSLTALDGRTDKTLGSAEPSGNYTHGPSIVVAGGRVFVRTWSRARPETSAGGTLAIEAFRASDGERLWHAGAGVSDEPRSTGPAADQSLVVFASADGFLYALDAKTGAQRWRSEHEYNGGSPALVNGLVWTGDTGGRLVAFDAEDGRALWRSPPFPLAAAQAGEVSVVVAGEYVLAATGTDGIRAYRVPSH